MAAVLGVVIFVVGLLVSIALHEVGHMVPAKKFGVRVSEYFVGFGPTLWSRRGKETEYGVKAIPLGGYVRLVGMIPPEEAVKPVRGTGRVATLIADTRAASVDEVLDGEDHRAFYHLAWWKKVIVMFGGPVVNLIIAVFLFTVVMTGIGMPTSTTTVSRVAECVPAAGATECSSNDPASPASVAGLQEGDTIIAVNDVRVDEWTDITSVVAASAGEPVTLTVERGNSVVDVEVTPASYDRPQFDDAGKPIVDGNGDPVTATVGYVGLVPTAELASQPITAGLEHTGMIVRQTIGVVATLPVALYHVTLAALGEEDRSQQGLVGIVGVGRIAADVASADIVGYDTQMRIADMLMLLAGLNLALFVFNMIPLVPLDGGHIAAALWQGIKNGWARLRRLPRPAPVDVARMMPLAYGVFGLLVVMGGILIWADVVAPVTYG